MVAEFFGEDCLLFTANTPVNGIAKRLKKLADAAHRSLSAQIVFILEQGLTNLSPEEKAIISED